MLALTWPSHVLLHEQLLVGLVGVGVVHLTLQLALHGVLGVLELLRHLVAQLVVSQLTLHLLAGQLLVLHLLTGVVGSRDDATKLLEKLLLMGCILVVLDVRGLIRLLMIEELGLVCLVELLLHLLNLLKATIAV